ncbi:BMC domain-containing protein [Companilactobacillus versmoldensis]|uniref:Ethanolamine propanediol utilization protein n=1 Tax=Companilactobacillus versmoldensis DSM 14857 = KCTC 3814 TaxID=1423815 RepID=A0A0R1SNI1_9LACO|nr:BMC domain-containing protein [Companilactobacillus versmoldensis]KRL68266.1 ethanolamine propanediol utilization protein [Companilactobacillus versmoldensis DSM 14857 = KCTC 3814]
MNDEEFPERIIQEYVPGKQITLAHIIANPNPDLYEKLGVLNTTDPIGIITLTPAEATIIAGDIAIKSGDIQIAFLDRFSGSLFIVGRIDDLKTSLQTVLDYFEKRLKFSVTMITRS